MTKAEKDRLFSPLEVFNDIIDDTIVVTFLRSLQSQFAIFLTLLISFALGKVSNSTVLQRFGCRPHREAEPGISRKPTEQLWTDTSVMSNNPMNHPTAGARLWQRSGSMSPGEPGLLLLLLLLEGTEEPRETAVTSPLTPPPNPLAMMPDKNSCLNRLVTQLKGPQRDTTTFQI